METGAQNEIILNREIFGTKVLKCVILNGFLMMKSAQLGHLANAAVALTDCCFHMSDDDGCQ